jgi:hypothetical protein
VLTVCLTGTLEMWAVVLVSNSMIHTEDFIATELLVRPKKNRGQVLAV